MTRRSFVFLVLCQLTLSQALQAIQFDELFEKFAEASKTYATQAADTISSGAQETWKDVKELCDEISTNLDISGTVKRGCEKIYDGAAQGYEQAAEFCGNAASRLDVRVYLAKKIGQSEIAFYQLMRNIYNATQAMPEKVTTWIAEHKKNVPHKFSAADVHAFAQLIDSKIHEKIALRVIGTLHNSVHFQQLANRQDNDYKQRQFDFLFAFYATGLLTEHKDDVDALYVGLAYAKVFLEAELAF